jgi:hypothetical protein
MLSKFEDSPVLDFQKRQISVRCWYFKLNKETNSVNESIYINAGKIISGLPRSVHFETSKVSTTMTAVLLSRNVSGQDTNLSIRDCCKSYTLTVTLNVSKRALKIGNNMTPT